MALRGFTPSSDHFDKICQFLAGIEIYPFAGRIGKSQAPVTFALDPHQVIVSFRVLDGILTVGGRLSAGCHGGTACQPGNMASTAPQNWSGRKANPVARIFKATENDSPSPWGDLIWYIHNVGTFSLITCGSETSSSITLLDFDMFSFPNIGRRFLQLKTRAHSLGSLWFKTWGFRGLNGNL